MRPKQMVRGIRTAVCLLVLAELAGVQIGCTGARSEVVDTDLVRHNLMQKGDESMMKILNFSVFLLFFVLGSLLSQSAYAGSKGSLSSREISFFENTINPILIKNGVCSSVNDCDGHQYFGCLSYGTLSCNVYGITRMKTIKEIFSAFLNSGIPINNIEFYADRSWFSRPILSFDFRAEGGWR